MIFTHEIQPGRWSVIDTDQGILAHGVTREQAQEITPLVETEPALWRSAWAAAVYVEAVNASINAESIADLRSILEEAEHERLLALLVESHGCDPREYDGLVTQPNCTLK